MADSIEIANAYVALTTKMPGVKKDVESSLGETEGVSAAAGAKAGSSFALALAGAVAAAAVAVAAAVGGLYDIGSQIDDAKDTLRVFTTETGAELEALGTVVDNVARETPASLGDIASTVATLHQRLGLTGDDLQSTAEQYLEAGRLFGEQVDVQATTGLFNVFKIGSDDVSGAMDTLFNAARVAGVGINDLSGTVANAAPVAQLLGLSFEETTGLFAGLSRAGVDVNKVASTLGVAMSNLAKDGEEPADAFRRVTAQIQSYAAAGDIAKAQNLAASVFGTKGAAQFVAALQSGAVNLEDLGGSVSSVGDTILGVADDTKDFSELWQQFQNQAMIALEPLASSVFNALGDAMPSVTAALEDATPAITEVALASVDLLPTLVQLAVAVLPPLVELLKAITPFLIDWATSTSSAWTVISGFLSYLSGDKTLAQVSSEVAGVGGSFFDLLHGVGDVWVGINTFFRNGYAGIQSTADKIVGAGTGAWSGARAVTARAWNATVGTIQGAVNSVIRVINGLLSGVDVVAGAVGLNVGRIPLVNLGAAAFADGGWVGARPGVGILARLGEGNHSEVVQPTSGPKFEAFVDSIAERLGGGGMPSTLVVVDADGVLMGRMQVAADQRIAAYDTRSEQDLRGGSIT